MSRTKIEKTESQEVIGGVAGSFESKSTAKLDQAILAIKKEFGEGAIMRLGADTCMDVDCVRTDILGIDRALGGKGIPRGRIIEIYGPESSGKTTFALEATKTFQALGEIVAFVDVEHALDTKYAKSMGVDLDALLVSQPNSGEEALNIVHRLAASKAVGLIIVDSVAALVTKNEIEGEIGDAVVGAQARLMSNALRKLAPLLSRSNTTCLFTNQLREKIGVMFGNPETTPGGKALKFYSSIRIDIRRQTQLKLPDGTIYGNRTKVKVVKNKIAPPFKECEFEIHYGLGVCREASLLEEGIATNVIEKRGSWLSFDGALFAQGLAAGIRELKDNKVLYDKLLGRLMGTDVPASPVATTVSVAPTATAITSDSLAE